jgi:hypothetical protein
MSTRKHLPRPSRARPLRLELPALIAISVAASAACVGQIGDPEGDGLGGPGGPNGREELELAAPALPRLTEHQYRSTLADLFGTSAPVMPVEPDTKPYLFYSIGAASTTLSELGTQRYEEAADAVTRSVFSDPGRRAAFVGCELTAPGDACAADFLKRFGRRAFRRPLTADELNRWVGISQALAQPDAWEGLRLAVAGLLQSPYFLYRVELGEPDKEDPARSRLTGYEVASRLSFMLWNTAPDDALLDAAERGELDSREGIAAAARGLLDDERARAAIQAFFHQYLDLGRLDGITRDPASYPLFTPGITSAMRAEVEMLVDDVVFKNPGDARSIFSTRRTFVNADLAALYGVEAPGATATNFVEVELPADGPRAGILTLGAFLTMNAHETRTSPTARGKYVRERVLCQTVSPPPPDVDTTLDPVAPGTAPLTVREQLEEHRKNPVCAGCHAFIDPPGFLFEHFDSSGTFREKQWGDLPIDSSGDLDGKPLADARGLATELERDPRVGHCMVTQLFRHAQGRLETGGEEPGIDDLAERFAGASYDFKTLVIELVTHDAFRFAAPTEVK